VVVVAVALGFRCVWSFGGFGVWSRQGCPGFADVRAVQTEISAWGGIRRGENRGGVTAGS
jgi:hypothetical protein